MSDQIRTGQVIDALLAACRALPGFADPEACSSGGDQVHVWDGPELWDSEEQEGCSGDLVIGWGGQPDAATPAATSDWVAGSIAGQARPRDETTTLQCLASTSGHASVKEARDQALTILSAVARLCREDPSLGIPASGAIGGHRVVAFVTAGSLTQSISESSFGAAQEFSVTYQARV